MRILVVDDELVSRKKLGKILGNIGDCAVVDSGAAALEAFKQSWQSGAPFNLITLDISMPEMDGNETLFLIKQIEDEMAIPKDQRTRIIMVTAMTDKDSIANAVCAGCDGYIMKPFDREKILAKLEAFRNPQAISKLVHLKDAVLGQADSLERAYRSDQIGTPTLPSFAAEVLQALSAPQPSLEQIGDLILCDPVLSVRVIANANAEHYHATDPIRSVNRAINRMGLEDTRVLIESIAGCSSHEAMPGDAKRLLAKLWVHSLAVAHGARAIGQLRLYRDPDRLYLLGLTHDIGKFLLADGFGRTGSKIENFDMVVALPVIQARHNTFGGAILGDFKFPTEFTNCAKFHEGPEFPLMVDDTVHYVSIANRLACELDYSDHSPRGEEVALLPAARTHQLSVEALETVCDCMTEAVEMAKKTVAS